MSHHYDKNRSYLIRHRNKWQVRVAIPKDVQWAFGNKSIFKRSTRCNVDEIEAAKIERDRIIRKFKSIVGLHRAAASKQANLHQALSSGFTRRPFPEEIFATTANSMEPPPGDQETNKQPKNYPAVFEGLDERNLNEQKNGEYKTIRSSVDGWIKERLLKKSQHGRILRYDFWGNSDQ